MDENLEKMIDCLSDNDFEAFFSPRLTKLKKPKGENGIYYVIDTNVLIAIPDILNFIPRDNLIVIPFKVFFELDKFERKLQGKQKRNCQKANNYINAALERDDDSLQLLVPKFSLLPSDFNRRSPDNAILAVALQCPKESTIFISDDMALLAKCRSLDIEAVRSKNFLNDLRTQASGKQGESVSNKDSD